MIANKTTLSIAALALASGVSLAQAQVEEDSSAAFDRANKAMAAAMGMPAADSTVTTHANGMTSASMGLEAMKMLVVRQNADGSYSYGHADSSNEAQDFMDGQGAAHIEKREEQ